MEMDYTIAIIRQNYCLHSLIIQTTVFKDTHYYCWVIAYLKLWWNILKKKLNYSPEFSGPISFEDSSLRSTLQTHQSSCARLELTREEVNFRTSLMQKWNSKVFVWRQIHKKHEWRMTMLSLSLTLLGFHFKFIISYKCFIILPFIEVTYCIYAFADCSWLKAL